MKKMISFVVTMLLVLLSFSAIADTYNDYAGVYPYDTTGTLSQETLEKIAKTNSVVYRAAGLRVVSYIVESCGEIGTQAYADIVWNIRSSMFEDMENEMLILLDVEKSEICVKKGENFTDYYSEADMNECLDAAVATNPPNGYQYYANFYSSTITTMSNNVKARSEQAGGNAQGETTPGETTDEALANQPLVATNPQFVVQSDEYKALYPDQLRAVLVNNSDDDIKDAVVTFMGWDANGLPVFITMQMDFNPNVYAKKANYKGVNLVPGGTCSISLDLNEKVGVVSTVKVIVASYETFDGTTWTNPYYDEYIEQYAGKKLPQD